MIGRLRVLGLVAFAFAALAGCGGGDRSRSPLAVADYRLAAIEQRAAQLAVADIDAVMLTLDGEAYERPAALGFRDGVTRFYRAMHPACLRWSHEESEQEQDFIAEAEAPLDDFNALVARLSLTPLRRDLELAWQRAALDGRKAAARRDCGSSGGASEIMRNSPAQMRDALDRMEGAMTASGS